MGTASVMRDWESNVERRLGIIEQHQDRMLDPETGIYAKLAAMESRLVKWALAIVLTGLVNVGTQAAMHHW